MNDFFTVGIGSSAGGTPAYDELIAYLPNDINAAFIIVEHLHSDYKSLNYQLLQKHTLKVFRAIDQQTVQKGCIYCIPEGVLMTIKKGQLRLIERHRNDVLNYSIDIFFRSLAIDAKDRAIAVSLSGYGRDGALGVREIHRNRGIVMVQTPSSAKHPDMPESIIALGNPHFILPPKELAEMLVEIIRVKSLISY